MTSLSVECRMNAGQLDTVSNLDTVRILLEHGADVNTKDKSGKLHTLSQYLSNHPSIYIYVIKMLMELKSISMNYSLLLITIVSHFMLNHTYLYTYATVSI